jgi:hypothetical protein
MRMQLGEGQPDRFSHRVSKRTSLSAILQAMQMQVAAALLRCRES